MALRPILIDTNAYATFKNGLPEAITILQQAPLVGLNPIVIGELLAGFVGGTRATKNKEEFQLFLAHEKILVFAVDEKTAEFYAIIYQALSGLLAK